MEIVKHWLKGVVRRETPNKGGIIEPRYLVFHFTAGRSASSSVESLCNPESKASAHLVVGRDGSMTQLAPFNVRTWHAGVSHWDGITGLNQCSIGIEMDNAGRLTRTGSEYRAWFGAAYPEEQVVHAQHRFESSTACWHAYTPEQIDTALSLAQLLSQSYNLKDIVGHEDIARGRKCDPGPAFPLANIHSKVFGRSDDDSLLFEVTVDSLNIRKGPGIEYEPVASPLMRGTRVSLLEKGDRWSRVDIVGPNDIEGWVSNKFLTPVVS